MTGLERLLVVEDDAGVRTTIVTFLELEGYAVDAVSSTREALARLEAQPYPIVISDIYLDERTGLDVLDAARTKWNFLGFEPGLVGGHSIGVDPYYLSHLAQQVGHDPQVILAGREIQPAGVPGMIQGIVLFCLIGSDVVLRYSVRLVRRRTA